MGLLYKPWPAHDGGSISKDRERSPIEEVDSSFRDDFAVAANEVITVTSLHCCVTEDQEIRRLPRPELPPRDGSPPIGDPSLPIHRHPLLGPFDRFPGTQFWEVYWHNKSMIKWDHWQLLTNTTSVGEIHPCIGDMINHHGNLLQSIENQRRDGMAEDPLLFWLLGDHAQLLETTKFVLQYFETIRIPPTLKSTQEQNPPQKL